AGYGVDQKVLDAGIDYLERTLNGDGGRTTNDGPGSDTSAGPSPSVDRPDENTRAYILFVLAEAGRADRGRTVALFEQRAKLAIYGRAYMLMTLKTLGGEDARIRTLVGELMSTAIMHTADAHWEERGAADYWTMSSDPRTTALALQALVRADP